tara:strand:- start:3420 stop:4151 length:732 start_codon:yes stop_codon:yes gene_type:complete
VIDLSLPSLVPIYEEEEEEWESPVGLEQDIVSMRESIEYDKRIRSILFVFTALLVMSAPVVSYIYPTAWTYILAAALAFTIGTNLLISVVTVRVEDKADLMEARMVELLESLHVAANRLEAFHTQLDGINVPAIRDLLENVRDEVAPGLHSFDDIDIRGISDEIRKASQFIDTLDMDKVANYLKHIRKEEDRDKPLLSNYGTPDPEYNEYWEDDSQKQPQDNLISNLLTKNDETEQVLSRLMG